MTDIYETHLSEKRAADEVYNVDAGTLLIFLKDPHPLVGRHRRLKRQLQAVVSDLEWVG